MRKLIESIVVFLDPEVQKLGKENTNDDNAELEEAKKD
jgi:hypothetical protein